MDFMFRRTTASAQSEEKSNRILIVGIGGATSAGKSTLSQAIHREFQCKTPVLCQDDFASNPIPILPSDATHSYVVDGVLKDMGPVGWQNWECVETISVSTFLAAIIQERDYAISVGDRILVVEGFLLFADERVSSLCDIKFYLEIPKEICYQRRRARGSDTVDMYSISSEYTLYWLLHSNEQAHVDAQSQLGQFSLAASASTTSETTTTTTVVKVAAPFWLQLYFDDVIWPHYLKYKTWTSTSTPTSTPTPTSTTTSTTTSASTSTSTSTSTSATTSTTTSTSTSTSSIHNVIVVNGELSAVSVQQTVSAVIRQRLL